MLNKLDHLLLVSFAHSLLSTTHCHLALRCEQLNIFLAILIEGYTKVKEGMVHSKGLPEELHGVLSHEFQRLMHYVSREPSPFVSDDRLAHELALFLRNTPTSMNRAMKDYTFVALGNYMEVSLQALVAWMATK